jgi:WD40-like Beta Propeller Repeat
MLTVDASDTVISKRVVISLLRTRWGAGLVISIMAGLFGSIDQAHATYPGENGVIVFETNTLPVNVVKLSPSTGVASILTVGHRPKVSPNGKRVAFLRGEYGELSDVYVMNIDGSNVVKLTETPASISVVWLPDGSKLAYTVAPTRYGVAELWTMSPDGTGKTRVRTLTDQLNFLDWSPSANAFTFEGTNRIYVADTVKPIAPRIWTGYKPTWAPDGAKIVFQPNNDFNELAEINPDGSGFQHLPPHDVTFAANAISPDGTLIAGADISQKFRLSPRARAGLPFISSWPSAAINVDWGRIPKNCHATTPQGGGGVLGGDVDFYADQCAIAVMPNPNASYGVLAQAVAVGPNGRVYARALKNNPLGGGPGWGPYYVIPGLSGNPDGINAKKIAIAGAKDGSFQVVITLASDNTVAHAMQYPNGSWSGFSRLDGFAGSPNFQARDVSITINGSSASSAGNAQVIANGLVGGSVFHRVRWPAGNWTAFAQVPGAEMLSTQAIAIASSEDLYTNLLVITTDGLVKQVLRDPSGNWGGWVNVGTPAGMQFNEASDVAIVRTELAGSPAYVMLLDSTNKAYFQVRANPNLVASWQGQEATQLITTAGRSVSLSSGGFESPILITRAYPQ